MTFRFRGYRAIALVFWILALTAIAIWSQVPHYVVGWDLQVYGNALQSLRAGHDPYADGIAVQRAFHNSPLAYQPGVSTPFTYVYSPLTLLLLRGLVSVPVWVIGVVYWSVYFVCTGLAILAGWFSVRPEERAVFALLVPVAVFFPGLVQNDVLFSGNVAYILYGLALTAAVFGWRRGSWWPFYVVVLLASCFKAPLLYLLAIPVLSARRQWVAVGVTGLAGVGLFAMQPRIWPTLFQHYLNAVELQFSYNHDFSSSPAGLMANALYNRVPYTVTSAVCYLAYAAVIAVVLLKLRRRFFAGILTVQQWVPVMLTGVFLLNPRIMEYDVAPITVPLALVAWRVAGFGRTRTQTIVCMAVFFALLNGVFFATGSQPQIWRYTECFTLVTVFAAGAWTVFQKQATPEREGSLYERVTLHAGS